MARITIDLSCRLAWWWRWLYCPLTRFGLWLGLPLNPAVIVADLRRAMKIATTMTVRE